MMPRGFRFSNAKRLTKETYKNERKWEMELEMELEFSISPRYCNSPIPQFPNSRRFL